MPPTIYPAANRSQWFANRYPGSIMELAAPVVVIHTTETSGWPGYEGGGTAPTFTIHSLQESVRQHFPVNMSSRALRNLRGGVQTNTQGAIQIELIGTCAKGGPGLYWPGASDANMAELVDLLVWLHRQYGLKLQSPGIEWVAYPKNQNQRQRMSNSQWLAFEGICGHQHVPENLHGDPGEFPIERLLELCRAKLGGGTVTSSVDKPVPVAPTDGAKPKPPVKRTGVRALGIDANGKSKPISFSATLDKSVQNRKYLQQVLQAQGYYKGAIDGVFGPQWDAALREWRTVVFKTRDPKVVAGKIGWDSFCLLVEWAGFKAVR